MEQKKPLQEHVAATDVLKCSTSQAQKLAKPLEQKCFTSYGKKYYPLILFCEHLDSFIVSPSAKQKTHWHSHHLWFDACMFQSAKIASSKKCAVVNKTLITWICRRETVAHMQLHFSDLYFQCVLEINFGGSVSQFLTDT